MSYTKDMFYITFEDVVTAAGELIGHDVWRKPNTYILLCDAISETGTGKKFPDNRHGYTEAINWIEQLAESVADE